MKKNVVMTLAAAALVGAIGVGSTFAYMTASTNTLTNTFTVGNVSFVGDGIYESTVARNTDGVYADTDGEGKWTATSNAYTNIVSGETVYKDPTVEIAKGSEICYVYAEVTYDPTQVSAIAYNTADWTKVSDANGKAIYVKKNVDAKNAQQNLTLFSSVTFASLSNDTKLNDISVKAFAIQANGVDDATALSEAQAFFAK